MHLGIHEHNTYRVDFERKYCRSNSTQANFVNSVGESRRCLFLNSAIMILLKITIRLSRDEVTKYNRCVKFVTAVTQVEAGLVSEL